MITASRLISRLSCAELGNAPWTPPASLPQATLPSRSDVAIVGAGLTGLMAAVALASAGREVVVVDYAFGSGATSRSGGIVLGDTLVGASPSFTDCDNALRELVAAHRIGCDLTWEGCLELARDDMLSPQPINWHDGGTIRLATIVGGGVLDPSKLLGGLAALALQSGARVVDHAAVESIDPDGDEARLVTSRGTLAARHIVMAVDATSASAIDPWDERGITVALQTWPLEPSLLARVGLRPNQAFYTRDLPLVWGRVMDDGSLLIGREFLELPNDLERLPGLVTSAGARLLARVRGFHPLLKEVGLKRVWGGPVARTSRGLPIVSRDEQLPSIIWAGGYGGHGIAQALRVGHLVAEALTVPPVR